MINFIVSNASTFNISLKSVLLYIWWYLMWHSPAWPDRSHKWSRPTGPYYLLRLDKTHCHHTVSRSPTYRAHGALGKYSIKVMLENVSSYSPIYSNIVTWMNILHIIMISLYLCHIYNNFHVCKICLSLICFPQICKKFFKINHHYSYYISSSRNS